MDSQEQAIRTPLPLDMLAEWRRHGPQAPASRQTLHRAGAVRQVAGEPEPEPDPGLGLARDRACAPVPVAVPAPVPALVLARADHSAHPQANAG